MADKLFELKTQFYIGNYQGAINESNHLKVTGEEATDKMVYLYRSLIEQRKFNTVISEVGESGDVAPPLRAVRLLALYLSSPAGSSARANALEAAKELLLKHFHPTVALMAASIYYLEGSYDDVFRSLHNVPSLESHALQIQALLKINRVDLARKQLATMKAVEEDATLTQLAEAWVNLAVGGERVQEAFYIFQELAEKHSVTVKLLNGQAVCHMHLGRFAEAEELLNEALERNNNDCETLVNLVVNGRHRGKGEEVIKRNLSQLRDVDGRHPFLEELDSSEALFDKTAKNFAPTA